MFDSLTDQRWESAPVLGNLAQAHVDGLNGVGGVDHLANFRWIVEKGNEACPVPPPGLHRPHGAIISRVLTWMQSR